MLIRVPTIPHRLDTYRPLVGDEVLEEIRTLAQPLHARRVVHVNATSFGGGVAELLASLVPLMADVGLEAEWRLMHASDEFFGVTKALHNGLQGMPVEWTPDMFDLWRHYNAATARDFRKDYDFTVVHDPQPAGLLAELLAQRGERPPGRWVWRCHIDLTNAQPELWGLLRPFVGLHDAAVFTLAQYANHELAAPGGPRIAVIPPAIDPLSPKNMDLSQETVDEVLRRYSLDPSRPILAQISRFDPWKDPLGVIDCYRLVKRVVPGVQLVLVGSMAADDPEGWTYLDRTRQHAGEDPDIHLLTNLDGVGHIEVNAIQRGAQVIIQKSLREGFGLVVAEGLWKGRPVVGADVGGISLQIVDGQTGLLVDSVQACAEKSIYLLGHPAEAEQIGQLGRERVRQHFLITRYLRDYLRLFNELETGGPNGAPPAGRLQVAARPPGRGQPELP